YAQWFARAATHRILPLRIGPSGLRVRWIRSRSSKATVVRGKLRARARAQDAKGRADPVCALGRNRQASSLLNTVTRGLDDPGSSPKLPGGLAAGATATRIATRAPKRVFLVMHIHLPNDDPRAVVG